MRFLVDAQLPPVLAKLLREKGHEAEHVAELAMHDADDSSIWNYALEIGAIVVTKDEDFPHRQTQGNKIVSVVVWLRIGNASRRALLNWFEPLLPKVETLLEDGEQLVEIR